MSQPAAMKFDPLSHSQGDEGSISPLQGLLTKACNYLRVGEYADALDIIAEARVAHRGNIYLDTMASQIALLVSMTKTNALSEEQRERILDTFSSLIECATVEAEESPILPAQPEPAAPTTESADWKVVTANLVNNYLTKVDHWIHQGEYQKALTEIHRIYEVDPHNATAKALEQEIVRKVNSVSAAVKQPVSQPAAQVSEKVEANPFAETANDFARVPKPTEKQVLPQRPRLAPPPAPPSRRRPTILIGTLATAAIGFVVLILIQARGVTSPTGTVPVAGNHTVPPIAETKKQPVAQAPTQQETERTTPVPLPSGASTEQPTKTVSLPAVVQNKEKPKITKPAVAQTRERFESRNAETDRSSAVASAPVKKEAEKPVVAPEQKKPALLASNEPSPPPSSPVKPFVVVQKEPQIVRLEKPVIPDHVFITSTSVQILVRVQIGTDGKPLQAKIVKSSNALADQAIIDAVMKSEYTPGIMSAGPVKTWVNIPFTITK